MIGKHEIGLVWRHKSPFAYEISLPEEISNTEVVPGSKQTDDNANCNEKDSEDVEDCIGEVQSISAVLKEDVNDSSVDKNVNTKEVESKDKHSCQVDNNETKLEEMTEPSIYLEEDRKQIKEE